MRRGQPYSLAATVIQRCVTTPGPSRSASVTVSPAIGCLLSLFEAGSGLLEEDRSALKSFNFANSSGSWAAETEASVASAAADRASAPIPILMSTSAKRFPGREACADSIRPVRALLAPEHADRVEAQGAPGGNPAGGESRGQQRDRHRGVDDGVERARFEEQGREKPRQQQPRRSRRRPAPRAVSTRPWPTTRRTTSALRAPSASRIPISRARLPTS